MDILNRSTKHKKALQRQIVGQCFAGLFCNRPEARLKAYCHGFDMAKVKREDRISVKNYLTELASLLELSFLLCFQTLLKVTISINNGDKCSEKKRKKQVWNKT